MNNYNDYFSIISSYRLILPLMLILSSLHNIAISAPKGHIIDATRLLEEQVTLPQINRNLFRNNRFGPHERTPILPSERALGEKRQFWLRNFVNNRFEQANFELKAVGDHCHIYVQLGQNIQNSAIERIKRDFDQNIYSKNTQIFGHEARPGIDGDMRINLLIADIIDGYSDENDGFVAGFFFAGDQIPQSEYDSFSTAKSNEADILYLDCYPSDPTENDYLEIVAHEFQHMIHYNHDPEETTWLNEGCSQIAPVFCGFDPPAHYKIIKESPDKSLNYWSTYNPLPDYGWVYIWNQYITDRLLNSTYDKARFFHALVANKKKSIVSYSETLGLFNSNFTDIYLDFVLANRINDPNLEDGRYCYKRPELKNFRLPPSKKVDNIFGKFSPSVQLWGSTHLQGKIQGFNQNISVSFSGYRRSTAGTYPDFKVAVILSHSLDIAKPRLKYMDLIVNPNNSNRLIGDLFLSTGNYDQLDIVIASTLPENMDDTKYMPVPGFICDLEIKPLDSGRSSQISVATAGNCAPSFDAKNFVLTLEKAYKRADSDDTVNDIQPYTDQLTEAIRADLMANSTKVLDDFTDILMIKAPKDPVAETQNAGGIFPIFAKNAAENIVQLLLFMNNQNMLPMDNQGIMERVHLLENIAESWRILK